MNQTPDKPLLLVEQLRQKARGEKNSVGDQWGDWICDEAADAIGELVAALRPLASLQVPARPEGTAGAYSIRHSEIERAQALIAKVASQ